MKLIKRPNPKDAPSWYKRFWALAPGNDLFTALENNRDHFSALIHSLRPAQLQIRYAANKWTLGQVLIHLADEERYYAYKAFCCSRGASVFLEVPTSDTYKADFNAYGRSLQDIHEDLAAVRAATITLFQTMTPTMLDLRDESQAEVYTARSLGWFTAGHSNHHLRIIYEKYLITKQ